MNMEAFQSIPVKPIPKTYQKLVKGMLQTDYEVLLRPGFSKDSLKFFYGDANNLSDYRDLVVAARLVIDRDPEEWKHRGMSLEDDMNYIQREAYAESKGSRGREDDRVISLYGTDDDDNDDDDTTTSAHGTKKRKKMSAIAVRKRLQIRNEAAERQKNSTELLGIQNHLEMFAKAKSEEISMLKDKCSSETKRNHQTEAYNLLTNARNYANDNYAAATNMMDEIGVNGASFVKGMSNDDIKFFSNIMKTCAANLFIEEMKLV